MKEYPKIEMRKGMMNRVKRQSEKEFNIENSFDGSLKKLKPIAFKLLQK